MLLFRQVKKKTIANVIKEVRKAGVEEIIVAANGADEVTVKRAIEAGATVLHYKQRLGHNVPRAIGAMYSSGEVCLFVDGDIVISAEHLRPYLEAADQGVDVALNNLECLLDEVHPIHSVSASKYFLNIVCKRPDLTINTTTAIPHAIKRDVMEKVSYESLIIPPLFQLKKKYHVRLYGSACSFCGCGANEPDSKRAYESQGFGSIHSANSEVIM